MEGLASPRPEAESRVWMTAHLVSCQITPVTYLGSAPCPVSSVRSAGESWRKRLEDVCWSGVGCSAGWVTGSLVGIQEGGMATGEALSQGLGSEPSRSSCGQPSLA